MPQGALFRFPSKVTKGTPTPPCIEGLSLGTRLYYPFVSWRDFTSMPFLNDLILCPQAKNFNTESAMRKSSWKQTQWFLK